MDSSMPNFNNADDHDILIELRTNMKSFTDQYAKDMSELKNGTANKLADHEVRIRALEIMVEKVDPLDKVKRLIALEDKVQDFFTRLDATRWTIAFMAGTVGATVLWVLTQLPGLLRAWGVKF